MKCSGFGATGKGMVRDEQVHQLSDDHTYAGDLMRIGVIGPDEVRNHTYSHVLTRSVGPKEVVRVDTLLFDVLPGDVLVLCTDGLSAYLESAEDLLEALDSDDLRDAPVRLVEFANARGGRDNVSVVVVAAEAGYLRAYGVLLAGRLSAGEAEVNPGECFGVESIAVEPAEVHPARALEDSLVAMLPWKEIDRLARRRSRLGCRIFRNLVCDLAARAGRSAPVDGTDS